MDILEDIKILLEPKDIQRIFKIRRSITSKIKSVNAEFSFSKEPMPFDKRIEGIKPIKKGEKWGGMFDSAWFHFSSDIDINYIDKKLCLIVDISGEGLVVDENNNALQGISNPVYIPNVAEFFNLTPGKTIYILKDNSKLDVWIEGGFNGISGKEIGSGKLRRADLAVFNEEIKDFYFDYLSLAYLKVIYKGDDKKVLDRALNKSYSLYLKGDYTSASMVLKEAYKPSDSDITISAVGHSHLDLAWLWPIRETKRKAVRTLSTAIKNMDLYPDYFYGASQPQEFVWIKEKYPTLYKELQQKCVEGRFEPQGGMWVECDTNLSGGESLIRQFLYGKEFWEREFNTNVKNCWLPDVFGYSGALPQILKKCGVDYFMTQKLSWNEHNEFPYETFMWEGISKDKVLTHLLPANTYNSSGAAPSLLETYNNHKKKDTIPYALMLYGAGDGGGGPCECNIELLKHFENVKGLPKVKLERADTFFEKIKEYSDKVPTYKGELYLEKHQGTYTTQSNNKKFNRKCELALHDVEFLGAIAKQKGYNLPQDKIDEIWKEVLLYEFHDILPGSAIHRVYQETNVRYKDILSTLYAIRDDIMRFLKKDDGLSLINTTPFNRREYIKHDNIWYSVDLLPYETKSLQKVADIKGLSFGDNFIENDILKVVFSLTGEIISIVDKKTKTEFNNKYLNRLNIYNDKKLYYNAWDIDINYTKQTPKHMNLVDRKVFVDGCRVIMEQRYSYNKSKVFQKVTLTLSKPYVEFNTRVDWQETHKMLRADFEPNFYSDEVTADIQFGNIKRSTRLDNKIDWAQFEVSAHKYVDVSNEKNGSAIMSTSKYGYRVKDGLISLNLLRSPVYPDESADKGQHHFRYAYYPHLGDVFEAEVPKWSYLFNYAGIITNDNIDMPSVMSVDKKNIIVETIKTYRNGDGIIVRLYENEGKETSVKISQTLGQKWYLCDMLENILEETTENQEFYPYEIKTILIK